VKALVKVTLKHEVLDPNGMAIRSACCLLGFVMIDSV